MIDAQKEKKNYTKSTNKDFYLKLDMYNTCRKRHHMIYDKSITIRGDRVKSFFNKAQTT